MCKNWFYAIFAIEKKCFGTFEIALFSNFRALWQGEINSNHVPHYIIIQCSVFYYRKRKWLPLDWTLLLFKCTVCVTFCYLVKGPNMFGLVSSGFGFEESTKCSGILVWFRKIVEINYFSTQSSEFGFWVCSEFWRFEYWTSECILKNQTLNFRLKIN